MPIQTIPSALLKLHELGVWHLPRWQELTGVALNLDAVRFFVLPKGWTAHDFTDVQSFYNQYRAKTSEDAKIIFASGGRKTTSLPGRKVWKKWVDSIVKTAKIHEKIAHCFSSANCHPSDVDPESRMNGGSTYICYCIDDIAHLLFGPEILDTNGRLMLRYRTVTQAICLRTWYNLARRLQRAHVKFEKLEVQVTSAFEALNETELTRAQVASVIRIVSTWRKVAELLNTVETMEKVERMEGELERLLQELGADVTPKKKKRSTLPRLFTLSKEVVDSLATEDNVQTLMNMYREFFDNPETSGDNPVIEYQSNTLSPLQLSANCGDTGVEYEARMSPAQLAENLGFVRGVPLLFNKHRRVDGLDPWANGAAFVENAENLPLLMDLNLHWHQLAGVHAIIRTCFTEQAASPNHCTGVLVADEVGLGKTYQAATVIAFLADAALRQKAAVQTIPPILRERPYLQGKRTIPHLPHIIVVPGTLLSQWHDEIRILFAPKGIDILVYPSTREERLFFWSADGQFAATHHTHSSVIILVTQSILQKEYSELYEVIPKRGAAALPWTLPKLLRNITTDRQSHSLFGASYLSGTIDEAHGYRNYGPRHAAALLILNRCILRMPLTATPLQTSTKNLAAMGRLIGIAHFFTRESWEEEKRDAHELNQARKELADSDDPLSEDESKQDPVKLKQVEIARRMYKTSEGHVIRRTAESLDWTGKCLIPLPPLRTEHVYLNLTERELKIITAKGVALQEDVGMSNVSKLTTRGFYIEYRTSVMYAREDVDEEIPYFRSLEEWEAVKSTKLDTAAQLCQYLLKRDELPLPIFSNGQVHFPPVQPVRADEPATRKLKIVISMQFPSMISLLVNIFQLYGVEVLSLHGSMTFSKRTETIKKFRADPEYRVLALSSVGTTGINLSNCNVVIFLDQPWSAQEVRQMTGRIYRQPQKNPVLSIHLLANDTADVLVSDMGKGKQDMMEAFLSKEAGQVLYDLLAGGGGSFSDDDEAVSAQETDGTTAKSRQKTKKSQSTNADGSREQAKAKAKKGKAKAKNKANPRFDSPDETAPNTSAPVDSEGNHQDSANEQANATLSQQQQQDMASQGVNTTESLPLTIPPPSRSQSPLSEIRQSTGDPEDVRPSTPPPPPEHENSILGKRLNDVLSPIQMQKASSRPRLQFDDSDMEDNDGATSLEPISPNLFSRPSRPQAPARGQPSSSRTQPVPDSRRIVKAERTPASGPKDMPFHRQLDDLRPITPPPSLPSKVRTNPFAPKKLLKPKKG